VRKHGVCTFFAGRIAAKRQTVGIKFTRRPNINIFADCITFELVLYHLEGSAVAAGENVDIWPVSKVNTML